MRVIHYTDSSYDYGFFGGVPRFDFELKKIIGCKTFLPASKKHMLKTTPNETIIITNNGMCMDIPEEYTVIVVHHGLAITHKRREPSWEGGDYLKSQNLMAERKNTFFVAPSTFIQKQVYKSYGIKSVLIPHASDLDLPTKQKAGAGGIILGDWRNFNKGSEVIERLTKRHKFAFKQLKCGISNQSKERAYAEASIYLTLSLCEGCSYSQLDALACGVPVLSTDVSLFDGDCDLTCGETISWTDRDDLSLIEEKLSYMIENYEKYEPKTWVENNIGFESWSKKWKEFLIHVSDKNSVK